MADYTLQQVNPAQKPFNHGTQWSYCTNAGGLLTRVQAGDVRVNMLFVDGHVENDPIDLQAYYVSSGAYWAWR
jgi:prepilin-type processing-associated H-X9-DG protein